MTERFRAIREHLVHIDSECGLCQYSDDDESISSCAWRISNALHDRIRELNEIGALVDDLLFELEELEFEAESSADTTADPDGGSS